MGAEVQKAQHEATKPAPVSTAAPHAPASVSAATVLSPQSLLGNSALKQRTATPPGKAPAQALLALQSPAGNLAVQRWAQNSSMPPSTSHIHRAAQAGVTGPGERLPHYRAIQRSFGPAHDLSGVRAHVGGPAPRASQAMQATAFTAGEHIGFKAAPDLWLAAHVVQQRSGVSLYGGVGRAGDRYERQADAVADRVASGRPVHDLLAGSGAAGRPAVQRCGGVVHEGCECAQEALPAEETASQTSTPVQRNGDGGFLDGNWSGQIGPNQTTDLDACPSQAQNPDTSQSQTEDPNAGPNQSVDPNQSVNPDIGPNASVDPSVASTPAVDYYPGEVESSFSSPGIVQIVPPDGHLLANFGVSRIDIKPELQQHLTGLIQSEQLGDAQAGSRIVAFDGYSDSVNRTGRNPALRAGRAAAVRSFLSSNGAAQELLGPAQGAPDTSFQADNSTAAGRAINRSVNVRFGMFHQIDPGDIHIPPMESIPDVSEKPNPTSTKFKIRYTGGWSVGPDVEAETHTFDLLDPTNHLLLKLRYTAAGISPGLVPGSVTAEGDWQEFNVPEPCPIGYLVGPARFTSGEAFAASVSILTIYTGHFTLKLSIDTGVTFPPVGVGTSGGFLAPVEGPTPTSQE